MSNGLLIFCGLTDDAQSGLTEILARLSRPVCLDDMRRKRLVSGRLGIGRKRHLANGTATCASIVDQVWLKSLSCHAPSLRQPLRRSTPVDFKRHHYRSFQHLAIWEKQASI